MRTRKISSNQFMNFMDTGIVSNCFTIIGQVTNLNTEFVYNLISMADTDLHAFLL